MERFGSGLEIEIETGACTFSNPGEQLFAGRISIVPPSPCDKSDIIDTVFVA